MFRKNKNKLVIRQTKKKKFEQYGQAVLFTSQAEQHMTIMLPVMPFLSKRTKKFVTYPKKKKKNTLEFYSI